MVSIFNRDYWCNKAIEEPGPWNDEKSLSCACSGTLSYEGRLATALAETVTPDIIYNIIINVEKGTATITFPIDLKNIMNDEAEDPMAPYLCGNKKSGYGPTPNKR